MTKHSYFPYTSTYSSTRHNTNTNTTSITSLTQRYNILQHSKAKNNTIFNNGRYTTTIPTDPHTISTSDIKQTCALYIHSFVDIDIIMPACTAVFDTFYPISCDVLSSLIRKLNKATCVLDPFPTKLLMSHLSYILDIIICIVNLCFSSGVCPTPCKSSIISPLIKKQGLDPEILKNYRPVANPSFISKII